MCGCRPVWNLCGPPWSEDLQLHVLCESATRMSHVYSDENVLLCLVWVKVWVVCAVHDSQDLAMDLAGLVRIGHGIGLLRRYWSD